MFRNTRAIAASMALAGLVGLVGGCGYTQVAAEREADLDGDAGEAREEDTRRDEPWQPPFSDPSARPIHGDEAREACAMALFVVDPFDSPETIRRRIEEDLRAIRTQWGGRVPETNWIYFRPPVQLTTLVLTLEAGTMERVRRGEYPEWSDLNERWGVDAAGVRNRWDGKAELTLASEFCVNIAPARRDYQYLPGVIEASVPVAFGDGSTIYFEYDLFTSTYIFREGEGNCEADCIHNRYWCFEVSGGNPHFVGAYDPEVYPVEPDWFTRAREIIERNKDWGEDPRWLR